MAIQWLVFTVFFSYALSLCILAIVLKETQTCKRIFISNLFHFHLRLRNNGGGRQDNTENIFVSLCAFKVSFSDCSLLSCYSSVGNKTQRPGFVGNDNGFPLKTEVFTLILRSWNCPLTSKNWLNYYLLVRKIWQSRAVVFWSMWGPREQIAVKTEIEICPYLMTNFVLT